MRNPYRTALPFGTTDLSSIQTQLDRLPEDDRALVIGYVERSNGDVLPAAFADPDMPFTARTVSEAIELQKKFLVQEAQRESDLRKRMDIKDKALEPLRAALSIQLIKREIVAREDSAFAPNPAGYLQDNLPKHATRPINPANKKEQILVTTYRLKNTSDNTIEAIKANVTIYKAHRKLIDFSLSLDGCYLAGLPQDKPLVPQESIVFQCGNVNKPVTPENRAYVDMSENELVVEWYPNWIRFIDGKELQFKE
ncbi:hypothetical protein [Beggiatoa leptomitoformis]|uniref:Uncharacterized protein n=1 Tax=Beggiatoa leptomitoformis TaxID=288004 RepID=A0A2N9YH63_9GAMM|nr:hypothetical protein [Beggiatoa leptomitoformis]ALG67915.2 hypothetical protein AL038_09575 [Beggiatoa leptomitoformis]AUI69814.2 hypothetical protein BLE401_14695 [Beggiatoa leptomitoformis]